VLAVGMKTKKLEKLINIGKRLYSIEEAAIYLGRSPWGVRELIWGGKIPSVKVGRRVHLDINDLDFFIEKNKVVNELSH
jgi:excisionase family DNA binding protein